MEMKICTYKGIDLVLLVLFVLFSTESYSQKLPKVQETNLHIPNNLRIDGKALEWKDFQAYNPTTAIYYTIANNGDNLYLILQARDPDFISKIILGAVTFTINKEGDKRDKDLVSITFPVYDRKEGPAFINLKNRPKILNIQDSKKQADSFMNVINKELISKTKLIGVRGIEALKDSVISIYNEEGIKASALFDNQMYYTYELLIPLKYLAPSVNKQIPFAYNIKLNGGVLNGANAELSPSGRFIIVSGGSGNSYMLPATSRNKMISYPTDFWGKYMLKN